MSLLLALCATLFAPHSQALEETEQGFSEPELAQILAPVALYPDSLLSHILIASTYPIEVVQANRWRKQNSSLSATDAVNKAEVQNWEPSVTALVGFPSVLETMSNDLNWTQKLGDAFLQDETQVLASIQTLRQQADKAESLSNMDKMQVTKVNNEIIIEPIETQVIYVPVYDPRVVYGHWHWHNYPPVFWNRPAHIRIGYSNGNDLFFWGNGIHISFNYFFSAFHWHDRHIIVTNHRHSNHYRPYNKITSGDGAHHWQHKPQHRRGVAYRTDSIKHRYNSNRPSVSHNKQQRKAVSNNRGAMTPRDRDRDRDRNRDRAIAKDNIQSKNNKAAGKSQHNRKAESRQHEQLTSKLNNNTHIAHKTQPNNKRQQNVHKNQSTDRVPPPQNNISSQQMDNSHQNQARTREIDKQMTKQHNQASQQSKIRERAVPTRREVSRSTMPSKVNHNQRLQEH